jgi:hypothetical protein
LCGTWQVRFTLERGREDLQRQLAGLDGQGHLLKGRLDDAATELAASQHRWQLERNRVSELEGLLAGMRARECARRLSRVLVRGSH